MALVQGVKEKVHLPIYDAVFVEPEKQLREEARSNTLKFFVDVQAKTKLLTNLQSASLLPHYNTFEARAMRVVISDLPPEFPNGDNGKNGATGSVEELAVTDDEGREFNVVVDAAGPPPTYKVVKFGEAGFDPNKVVTAELEAGLHRLINLLKDARDSGESMTILDVVDDDVTLFEGDSELTDDAKIAAVLNAGGGADLTVEDIEEAIESMEDKAPPKEQYRANGTGSLIGKFIYNTVTSLYVGEKLMIQMPTWFFPGGAGPYSDHGGSTTHGEPSPAATFRFAEPIFIDKQQNFRVEIEVPDSESLKDIQKIYGPMSVWVVLDGYMTRDVQ